jgi:molecular chaperone DnaK (HSP70)
MNHSRTVVGIDAGTATFEVSKISKTGKATPVEFPEGVNVLRSVVYFENGETPRVGQEAENMLLLDPANGVRHWKRHMGSDKILFTSRTGRKHRAEHLLVIFLLHCKEAVETDTGLLFREAVTSVPANYNDAQKDATIQAAKAAGFDNVSLIHEPTATMFSRLGNTERNVPDGRRLVVDVGGGTTDISLCEKIGNRYEIKATSGVPELGGMDFTQALMDYCIEEYS